MRTQKDSINRLKNDLIKNINMINFIENHPIDTIEIEGGSTLIKGKSDQDWIYISSSSESKLRKLLKKCNDEEYFAIVEDWMIPHISDIEMIDWKLSCVKLFFLEETVLSKTKHKIEELKIEDAEYIYYNSKYKDYTSIDYIRERIKNGISLGIYENKKLIGWVLTHDDGAIGFLNVIDEYRSKGYAHSLTASIIRRLREIKKIPFVHIEEKNTKSMNLALKIGFVKDRNINWIKRKKI